MKHFYMFYFNDSNSLIYLYHLIKVFSEKYAKMRNKKKELLDREAKIKTKKNVNTTELN